MSKSQIAKVTGWLLVTETVAGIVIAMLRPGNILSDHPDGVTRSMIEGLEDIAANSLLTHLTTSIGLFASCAFMLGMIGVERLLRDDSTAAYLRRTGLVVVALGVALQMASWATSHLTAIMITHTDDGMIGTTSAMDQGVIMVGLTGSFYLFATILTLVGLAVFGIGMMGVRLLGADRPLALLLAVIPGVAGVAFLVIGAHVHGSVIRLYLAGSLFLLLQVIWVFLLGLAFIRKSESIAAG